jgi:CxxC-x17-CxxC domain-containing protein
MILISLELHKVKTGKKKFTKGIPPNTNSPSKSFRNSGEDRMSRFSRDDRREESTTVTCSDCGTECRVPFVPRTDRPVYCSDCFRQNKPQDSETTEVQDIPEMTEVQDIPEMTEVQDIPEMTEVQDIPEMTEEKSQQL